ncbi:MAG: group II truncated hemoglobin [Deltaproteobacteria bacterium]|nr:group II truncated hemoglobin [Deltaproteobacteria bacterium]
MTPERPQSPYATLGGDEPLQALVTSFYDRMDADPAFANIRVLHSEDLSTARHKLFSFLSGWLGGPQRYIEQYGNPLLRSRHLPFRIGIAERDEWLACMSAALDDIGIDGPLRQLLDERFAHTADHLRNADVEPSQPHRPSMPETA